MRLNAEMRKEIRTFAVKKLDENRQDFAKVEQQLLVDCYEAVMSPDVRALIATLERKPIGSFKWFDYDVAINFNVAGQTVRLSQINIPVDKRVQLAVPYQFYGTTLGVITLVKHKALVERVRDWQGKTEKERADYEAALNALNVMLNSVSTLEKLKQFWPEGAGFFSSPPCTPRGASGLPAVQIATLNRMLGIETKDLVV